MVISCLKEFVYYFNERSNIGIFYRLKKITVHLNLCYFCLS